MHKIDRSAWILEVRGLDGEPLPASVIGRWQWYREASGRARHRHGALELSALIVSAAIPALAAFDMDARVIAIVGSLAVLLNGVRALGGFKETWTSRTQARYAIERQIARFATRESVYGQPGAESILVDIVEEICERDREGWAARRLSYGKAQDEPGPLPAPK
ncbi:DUF4231 domain-containing protein [Kribbella pratensis]|nr:DUF4231 domain-containing protein [Kribbella pratensis]